MNTDELSGAPEESLPLAQRIYDNWALLMVAGVAIMVLVYTMWGLWEITTLPRAPLP